jgi:MOSC domain-containing protein YiiM
MDEDGRVPGRPVDLEREPLLGSWRRPVARARSPRRRAALALISVADVDGRMSAASRASAEGDRPFRVRSVNVGPLGTLQWKERAVRSAFLKSPVRGPVPLTDEGFEGDHTGDRRVHGGIDQAVYAYPYEHYAFWKAELGLADLLEGSFGENLTLEGVSEEWVAPGDRLRIGPTVLAVTKPRSPCFKLNYRFQREDMIARFLAAGRPGFYLAVVRGGTVAAGDPVLWERVPRPVRSIRDAFLENIEDDGPARSG